MDYKIEKKVLGFCENKNLSSVPLYIIKDLKSLGSTKLISEKQKVFLRSAFEIKKGFVGFFPDDNNNVGGAIALIKNSLEPRKSIIDQAAELPSKLPNKKWLLQFIDDQNDREKYNFLLGWGLSFYKFHIKNKDKKYDINNTLCTDQILKIIAKDKWQQCVAELKSIFFTRDLINLPPNILTPLNYEKIIKSCFKAFSPNIDVFKGESLAKEFPLIDFVGRSSENKPMLLDINWSKNNNNYPNITLIGKGVTFDSGGLDIKPSNSMLFMKKDMGGSAIALGVAYALMSINCPVNLRVLLPLAENSISGRSMRPLDVVFSRNNTAIEIGNTDAEGRLLLADTLTFCNESDIKNDFIIDFATLTGAARVALGTELPALFTNDENLGKRIIDEGINQVDPMWQLPLFEPYERFLENKYDALSSTGSSNTGGAITAALFLKRFVNSDNNWAHIDLMAWNTTERPGFPVGGEAMGLRNIVNMILNYCKDNKKS